uniref:Uncharacterized protein n=1 Tax=Anguilla anguilla TaxID=7936 RepID=A0A0E9UKD6_ANGAN
MSVRFLLCQTEYLSSSE